MFERMVSNFIKVSSPVLYKTLILDVAITMNMVYLRMKGRRLLHHLHALYATDVMFQKANRPGGNMMEARPYLSAKH